jgi:hypothetical protein
VLDAERRRGVALRVEVDDQHAQSVLGQSGGHVDGGRRLADPALLVGDREDPGPARPAQLHRAALRYTARTCAAASRASGVVVSGSSDVSANAAAVG